MTQHSYLSCTTREAILEDAAEQFTCDTCQADLSEITQGENDNDIAVRVWSAIVETVKLNGKQTEVQFCNSICRARFLYSHAETATAKAALMRFVAALSLLIEEDVTTHNPLLEEMDADGSIDKLREMAFKLIGELDEDGSVEWMHPAYEWAGKLSDALGKEAQK